MKIVKSTVEIIHQEPTLNGALKNIELAARTAYKNEDKITNDSVEAFVEMIKNKKHNACLEHGTIYLRIPCDYDSAYEEMQKFDRYTTNPYSNVTTEYSGNNSPKNFINITTNYRVLVENDWLDDLQYICDDPVIHEKRITVKFICSRAIANEFVRHREFSFLQESTRFCNYSKDKFNNELTFIAPADCPLNEGNYTWNDEEKIIYGDGFIANYSEKEAWDNSQLTAYSYMKAEKHYLKLIEKGVKPQFARDILPLGLKTELVMTGTQIQWDKFFELRCATNAHPDAKYLADMLKDMMY